MYITVSDVCRMSMASATWVMAIATVIGVIISIYYHHKKK